MKLNIDCIRDIMLHIEDRPVNTSTTQTALINALPQYSEDDVYYRVIKLDEAGLLDVLTVPVMGSHGPGIKSIHELTFHGHEFLENIRTDDNWSKIKNVAGKAGSFSLQIISSIASDIIKSKLSNLL